MTELGQLTVATYCENCGFVKGTPEGEGVNRCGECGRYVSDNPDVCCARHEVRESPYPSGICPRCEQGRDLRAREQEMHQRRSDPQMHNMVDAPRY